MKPSCKVLAFLSSVLLFHMEKLLDKVIYSKSMTFVSIRDSQHSDSNIKDGFHHINALKTLKLRKGLVQMSPGVSRCVRVFPKNERRRNPNRSWA